ncbi:MAG TPA: hypothetical protein VKY59_21455 [Spirillospora sp.]|nr:hypothetical protein [Spirillospora sp.]
MVIVLVVVCLIVICGVCIGWRVRVQPHRFAYRKLDAEMEALRQHASNQPPPPAR